MVWFVQKICKCFVWPAPDSSAKLVRLCEAKARCVIHYEGIIRRDIKTVFYNSSCKKNIDFFFAKSIHRANKFALIHASVDNADFGGAARSRMRKENFQFFPRAADCFYPVMKEIYLSVARELGADCFFDHFFRIREDKCVYGFSLWRRGFQNRHIAQLRECKRERPRNRSCGKG